MWTLQEGSAEKPKETIARVSTKTARTDRLMLSGMQFVHAASRSNPESSLTRMSRRTLSEFKMEKIREYKMSTLRAECENSKLQLELNRMNMLANKNKVQLSSAVG
jgi:hypothetical protein